MDTRADHSEGDSQQRRRPVAREFWREGDDGLFSQSWYPICLSSEAKQGEIVGRSFLDGEVIVFRGPDGQAHVFSAFCLHMGANLKEGDVVDNRIRCPYHHWEYDGTGSCVKTGAGDPPPPSARLFEYPSQERWGLVFAFNGEQPLWDLPDFRNVDETRRYEDSELCTAAIKLDYFPDDPARWALPLDPWAAKWADFVINMEVDFFMQDIPILRSLHFKPGLLTKMDTVLSRHIDYLQSQPRAHPGAEFIR